MEISRNNYQVWISDYYDGSLSDSEWVILQDFLTLNPDLLDEFNSYQDLILHPDISVRMDKDSLRKNLNSENPDAIEHCALAFSEDDLSPEMQQEFSDLLVHSELARSETRMFNSLKLSPDNTVYPDKIRLKRIPLRAGLVKFAFRASAVAAAVALVISLSIMLPRQADNSYSYNSAYLLPFNNGDSPESAVTEIKPLLNAGRVAVKEIRIDNRTIEDLPEEEQTERAVIALAEKAFLGEVSFSSKIESSDLLAMSQEEPLISVSQEQNLSPRQFLAKNFRKHLLKEDINSTERLKAHELADVSIDGLNKLLGWEMQFEKEKTEDGKLASFRFTSQLLNLDTTKKKIED